MKKITLLTICMALMVALQSQTREIIYFEGFEGTTIPNLPTGWTQSTPGKWATLDNFANHPNMEEIFAPKTGDRMMVAAWSTSGDHWAFSPGFSLNADESYTVSFWYSDMGYQPDNEADNFEVCIAENPTPSAMGSGKLVFSQGDIVNGWDFLWKNATYTFTPTTAGTYYLGFHDLRPAGSGLCIAIDDITVTLPGDCNPATNLDVAYFSDCSAILKWDAPIDKKTKTLTDISEQSKNHSAFLYNIYRDNVKITSVNTESYTDSGFDATQAHTWAITVACDGENETEPVSKEMPYCIISVQENIQTIFTIVPNPATHFITISAESPFNKMELLNFLGQTILSQQSNSNTAKIDVSRLSNGIYFIRIISNNGSSVQRFVKQ